MRGIVSIFIVSLASAPSLASIVATVDSPVGTVEISSGDYGSLYTAGDGTIVWTGNMSQPNMGWEANWEYQIGGGASEVFGVMGITNMMAAPMVISFDVSATSNVTFADPVLSGASAITVLDTNLDGAAMDAVGDGAIYVAHIMGVEQHRLFEDPFGLSAAPAGVDFTGADWGPQPATMGISAGDMFGIDHEFLLTAGDQATVNSSFFIVPEPASLLLLVAGGLLIGRRRR